MTEAKGYIRTPETQNTNEWMMTGFVIASPSTGQIKALMPILNSYSDIRIEQIRVLDADTLTTNDPTFVDETLPTASIGECLPSEKFDAMLHVNKRQAAWKLSTWRSIMRHSMTIDMRHLSVMVGLASLLGAATNMLFSFATGSPAPQVLVISVTVLGFVLGRFLSDKLRREQHG